MFQSINQSCTRLPQFLLILIFCVVALMPVAALADGTGAVEPPIQNPDPDGAPAEDGLTTLEVATLWALETIL